MSDLIKWNKNTVPKCEDKTCSDEVLVTVEKYCRGTYEPFKERD